MSKLKLGMRVKFIKQVDLIPHTIVDIEETGTITQLDPDSHWHAVEVTLDKVHQGLDEWSNTVHMTDNKFDTEYPSIYDNCIPL